MAEFTSNTLYIPERVAAAGNVGSAMSGITIKASPELMREKAEQTRSAIARMRSEYEEMDRAVGRTGGYWNGEAAELHRSQYKSLQPKIQTMFACLEEHAANLQEIAALYTATQTSLTNMAAQLPTNAIE